MFPTLKPGDGLILYIYKDYYEIKVGDIIIYPHPSKTIDVVHRIIKIKPEGVITRGDNNNKIDPYTVHFNDIIGKVITVKRKAMLIPLKGGAGGLYIHKLMLCRKYLIRYGLIPLRFVSDIIAASRLFNIFHPCFNLRIIHIKKRNRDSEMVLVWGNRTLGRKAAESNKWEIRFPYKYFISTRRLEKSR